MNNNIFIGGVVTHLAENSLNTFFICGAFECCFNRYPVVGRLIVDGDNNGSARATGTRLASFL